MSEKIEALFTSALGLQAPWKVRDVRLDLAGRRIDFDVHCGPDPLICPTCGAHAQALRDRLTRSWRHLDLFQFQAWLHVDMPRAVCSACGADAHQSVPWTREAQSPACVWAS